MAKAATNKSSRSALHGVIAQPAIELSIVIPLYNEASVIEKTYQRLCPVLGELKCSYEIVIVNDGSTDSSLSILKQLSESDATVRIVSLARNFGHEMATTAGVNEAKGRAVIVMDADLQDPPEIIPQMIKKWREGFHVVYGVRHRRKGDSWLKKITAACFYRIFAAIADVGFPVDTGDFRLMDRRVVEVFHSLQENPRFFRGLISWIGFRQTGIPFVREARAGGESKYRYAALVKLAFDTLTAFSTFPALMIFAVSGLSAAGSFALTLVMAICALARVWVVPGWAWMGVAILDVLSIQFVCLSILGQYIVRTHRHTQRRPLYVIDTIIETKTDSEK